MRTLLTGQLGRQDHLCCRADGIVNIWVLDWLSRSSLIEAAVSWTAHAVLRRWYFRVRSPAIWRENDWRIVISEVGECRPQEEAI